MTSESDREKELEHRERILREPEVELRLWEMETNIHATDAAFHQTVKHQPENSQKPWMNKVILGGKLCSWCGSAGCSENSLSAGRVYYCSLSLVGTCSPGVRIASVLAGFIIVGALR